MKIKYILFSTLVTAVLATLFTPVSLRADTIYTDAASFSNAISTPNYYTNFIGLGIANGINQPLVLSGNGYSTEVTTGSGGANLCAAAGIIFDNGKVSLIFSFNMEEDVTAVGGNFIDGAGGKVVATLNDGTSYGVVANGFIGFTSSDPITSLTINCPDMGGAWGIPIANTIQFGAAELVPEPSTCRLFVLGGLGVLVLTVAVRRNRAAKR